MVPVNISTGRVFRAAAVCLGLGAFLYWTGNVAWRPLGVLLLLVGGISGLVCLVQWVLEGPPGWQGTPAPISEAVVATAETRLIKWLACTLFGYGCIFPAIDRLGLPLGLIVPYTVYRAFTSGAEPVMLAASILALAASGMAFSGIALRHNTFILRSFSGAALALLAASGSMFLALSANRLALMTALPFAALWIMTVVQFFRPKLAKSP